MPTQVSNSLNRNTSNGGPDGTTTGQSSTDLISFYGVTPIVQPAGAAQASVTTGVTAIVTTTTPTLTAFGYTTAQALQILTSINALNTYVNNNAPLVDSMRTALLNLGLIKGSA